MAKQIYFSFELEPGMIVYEDVFDASGRLILTKGMALDMDTISRLEFFSILEVPIENNPDPELTKEAIAVTEAKKNDSEESTVVKNVIENFSEKVKSSVEYKKFNTNYDSILALVTESLNVLSTRKVLINKEKLIQSVFNLVKITKTTIQLFDILSNMDSTDDQTYHHSLNVAVISCVLGKWLNLPQRELEELVFAALLHDVGKLTIPTAVLNKSGKLTDNEFKLVKSHVNNGYNILKAIKGLDIKIMEACLLHHERCDGSGYPFGVKSERITPFAKIIAIADVYDAMTSPRTYRKGLCPFEVIRIFDTEGLSKYDPHYIMTFMENIISSYLHNNVLLSDGRIGEIIMINKVCLYKPTIKCEDGFVNLLQCPDLKITSIV